MSYRFEVNIETPTEETEVKALLDWVQEHQSYVAGQAIGLSRAYYSLLTMQARGMLHQCNHDFKFGFNEPELAIEFAKRFNSEARCVL
jgi:hypothetical protein